jgi:uncharacterized YceG family protein
MSPFRKSSEPPHDRSPEERERARAERAARRVRRERGSAAGVDPFADPATQEPLEPQPVDFPFDALPPPPPYDATVETSPPLAEEAPAAPVPPEPEEVFPDADDEIEPDTELYAPDPPASLEVDAMNGADATPAPGARGGRARLGPVRRPRLPHGTPLPRTRRQLPPPPPPRTRARAPRPPKPPRLPRTPRIPRSFTRGPGRAFAAVLAVGGLLALWLLLSLFQPFKGDGEGEVGVRIPAGASADQIGDLLADRDVVSSGFFFSLRAALAGKRSELRSGTIRLARGMSYGAALDALTTAPKAAATFKVTLPEGRSRREMAPLAEQAGVRGSYIKAARSSPTFDPSDYRAPKRPHSLEGFLFPATYELRKGATARRLVDEQLKAFRANFGKVSLRYARRKNLTAYDVLIIASMVEREAQVARERPLIAAVIYNRLHDRMPLGIDATLRYRLNNWTSPLKASELRTPSAYNTRLRQGLPPMPIGNPGLASIRAAAAPARVSYLFYVVKPGTCGRHAFSSTDAQFQRDVARYNAARAQRGGRSPTTCPSG